MLGNTEGKHLCKYVRDYTLFDLETTGISSVYDEIIEISAVKVRGGKVVSEFSRLVNPGRHIPEGASAVNNITDDMVAAAPVFSEVLPDFLDFIGDDILVGHNIAAFDMKFIYRDCLKFQGGTLSNDYIDTLRLAKIIFPDWRHRRLSDLSDYYGISTKGAHRALADCHMNQKVFELMGQELAGCGTLSVKPEIRICRECGRPMKKRAGRFGEFWGCSGYPGCKCTEKI